MKKFISFSLVLFLAAIANAQFSYGPRIGLNIATQKWSGSGSEFYDLSSMLGLNIGVFGNYSFSERLSGQAELFYSAEGTKEAESPGDESGRLVFNYVRLPLLAQYHAGEAFDIETGPSVGFVVSAKEVWEGETDKITDGYKSTDFGWTFGLGYNLAAVAEGLRLGVRYYTGLTNITTRQNSGGADFKNRNFSIVLHYNLKK